MNILLPYTSLFLLSCTLGDLPDKKIESPQVVVNLNEEFQTIHSFGGSDCWSAKYIGTWQNETKKNQIADLLFSTDTLPDGQPKGIGLSLWRVNIGAGSFEQGNAVILPMSGDARSVFRMLRASTIGRNKRVTNGF